MSFHTDKWIVFQAGKFNAKVCLMKKKSSVLNDLLIRVDDLVNWHVNTWPFNRTVVRI